MLVLQMLTMLSFEDELEPDAKESNPENSDAEEENESSLQLSGV